MHKPGEKRPMRSDFYVGLVLTAAGLGLLGWIIPDWVRAEGNFAMSPRSMPIVAAGAMTAFAAVLALRSLDRGESAAAAIIPFSRAALARIGVALLLIVGGIELMRWGGLFVGGPALIAAFMLFMGERQPWRIALTATLPVAFVYLLLEKALRVPLP
jgi:hypothetical protein